MNTQICTRCGNEKLMIDFSTRRYKDTFKYNRWCKQCKSDFSIEWAKRNPEKTKGKSLKHYHKTKNINIELKILKRTKWNALKENIPFELTIEDIIIPDFCPVLNIPLVRGDKQRIDNSPSIDKIIPELGYIKGNVAIISWRANRIKSNGTAGEHEKIADYMKNCLE